MKQVSGTASKNWTCSFFEAEVEAFLKHASASWNERAKSLLGVPDAQVCLSQSRHSLFFSQLRIFIAVRFKMQQHAHLLVGKKQIAQCLRSSMFDALDRLMSDIGMSLVLFCGTRRAVIT